MFNRALQLYDSFNDVRRVILNTQNLNQEFIVSFLDRFENEQILILLKDLMINSPSINSQLVVKATVIY
jgi:hypothetical protein